MKQTYWWQHLHGFGSGPTVPTYGRRRLQRVRFPETRLLSPVAMSPETEQLHEQARIRRIQGCIPEAMQQQIRARLRSWLAEGFIPEEFRAALLALCNHIRFIPSREHEGWERLSPAVQAERQRMGLWHHFGSCSKADLAAHFREVKRVLPLAALLVVPGTFEGV